MKQKMGIIGNGNAGSALALCSRSQVVLAL
jgi:predicted dinucleotide-binding enzyme